MSRVVLRSDIVDYQTYNDQRTHSRPQALRAKAERRIHLGDHLTFLFENRTTLRYQIQEIMRAERTVREADIVAEIATYNAILGEPGDLGCALLIEIVDPNQRAEKLREWAGLQSQVYARLADGSQVFARFDPAQVGTDRLSAVQYLQFPVRGQTPVALGTDFEHLESEVDLSAENIAALTKDLAEA